MFFHGVFLSLVSFLAILLFSSLIQSVKPRILAFLLPLFPIFGVILLLMALFASYLYIIVLFCSSAFTCFYTASRLKKTCRYSFTGRPDIRKK